MIRSANTAIEQSHAGGRHVLSLFPGIDMLGRGFELEGYFVARGPDRLWGGDIRDCHPPAGLYDGVIGGSPCQDFSTARRSEPTGEGIELLKEFLRCVAAAAPDWFLLENVPTVPSVTLSRYRMQRFDLRASECGLRQRRLRHFQFGSRSNKVLVLERDLTSGQFNQVGHSLAGCCMASEGTRQHRRTFADFCELQGLPRDFDLAPLSKAWRYRVVGNGVPIPMARVVARAIGKQRDAGAVAICVCGCGRPVTGKAVSAGPACRKRLERSRRDVAGGARLRIVTL